nr:hypothetical protein [Tanacetum cinerariifolium]
MFYSHNLLARKGPLGTVWCAAHLHKKLNRSNYVTINIPSTVEQIMHPQVPIALRMSGHLLLGVVRVYSKKVEYLQHDYDVLRIDMNKAFEYANINLPQDENQAEFESITLPDTFSLDLMEIDGYNPNESPDNHCLPNEDISCAGKIAVHLVFQIQKILQDILRYMLGATCRPSLSMDDSVSEPIPVEKMYASDRYYFLTFDLLCFILLIAQSTKDKSQMVNDDNNNGTWKNGFTEVNRRKNFIKNFGGPSTSNVQYNQRKVTTKYVVKNKSNMNNEGDKGNEGKEKRDKVNNEERLEIRTNERPTSLEKIWRVDADTVNKLKRSANKYAVLTTEDEEFENICYDDRITVDRFILKKQKPKEEEMANWTYDMKQYLKYRWEAVNRGDDESDDENEVLEVNDPAISSLIAEEIQVWNIRGISNEVKQKEARNLIKDGKILVCAFIETHLKTKNIEKVGNKVFGNWDWCSNIQYSPTSCRIMLGWNTNLVRITIINRSSQTILCCVETIPIKIKFFCSIVYASNNGTERRRLWKELEDHKRFTRQHPWVLMGDFNVTLNIDEHSTGMSYRSMDMQEFFEAVNKLEVEDICSSGFHYTWTKSLKNPNCLTLKKLDRIMITVLLSLFSMMDSVLKTKRLDFSNFVAGKDNFIDVVKSGWNIDVQGCHMYSLAKKLKNLKKPLKKLSWCQGNVHERANNLKNELLKNQAIMEKNPFDSDARVNAAKALNDYIEASKDELSLLHQKAKVQWLREDEEGNVHEGSNVAEQFVHHFKKILGESKEMVALDDEIFSNKINSEDAAIMTSEITSDEIKEAIFDIDSNKASGPDFI